MESTTKKPVIILGAGLAGLTAANYLRQQNVPVVLFEAGSKIAGLAQSFHDDDGFTYDFGAHFVTNRLAETIGIRDKCRTVKHYAETVWLGGKSYAHPFGLMKVPRMTTDGISAKLKGLRASKTPESAAEWFRSNYGKSLANEVAIPLTEAWSGVSAEDLSPAVGDGISSGIGRTIWLKGVSQMSARAVACGYSRDLPEKASVYHVYPHGGIGALCQKLAEGLDDVIQLESPVETIVVDGNRAVGVRAKGLFHEAAAVISTAPVHILGKIIEGSDALSHLSQFQYRPMIFVNLRFKGRGLLPDVVTWTPENQFPFFRLTETPLSMPWLAPQGKTVVTVDIGCEKGDALWSMEDEALGEICIDNLRSLIPDAGERYLGCRVMRTPFAYPVFKREYESDRQNLAHGTGIENLHSIGRNGEFAHIFMEDVHCRTEKKVNQILTSLVPEKVVSIPRRALPRERYIADLVKNLIEEDGKESSPGMLPEWQVLVFSAIAFWLVTSTLVAFAQHPGVPVSFRITGSILLVTSLVMGIWVSRVRRIVRPPKFADK